MTAEPGHETVLLQQAVDALVLDPAGTYVDCTFGRGGHARAIVKKLNSRGQLLVIDKDPEAIEVAQEMFASEQRVRIVHGSFSRLAELVDNLEGAGSISGVLLDLGVSSPQLDTAQRGFSFSKDGPLDMRMNPNEGLSAAQWIATASEREIADVLYRFGEERHSRRMARAIVAERKLQPITTTARLAEIVKAANPSWERHKHPATRAFQGIRIYINQELEELSNCLQQMLGVLGVGGRLVVISFHSLEDRVVKRFISEQVKGDPYPPDLPVPQSFLHQRLKKIGKPVKPGEQEVDNNPRSRSAIMRVAEKIA